jgi:hypothetical protein
MCASPRSSVCGGWSIQGIHKSDRPDDPAIGAVILGQWFARSAPQITNSYNRNQRSDLRSDRDSNAGQAHNP